MNTKDIDHITAILKSSIERREAEAKIFLSDAAMMQHLLDVVNELQKENLELRKENQELKAQLPQLKGGYKVAAQTYGWESDDSK